MWIPQIYSGTFAEVEVDARGIHGFHPNSWEGYRMFRDGDGQRILIDAHDDIVWCDSIASVLSFHGGSGGGGGRYVRWFSPYGNICVYAQNMRFNAEYSQAALLV